MSGYRSTRHRLSALEVQATSVTRQYLESLSDAELEELTRGIPPEHVAAIRRMTDAELERLIDMPDCEARAFVEAKVREGTHEGVS